MDGDGSGKRTTDRRTGNCAETEQEKRRA